MYNGMLRLPLPEGAELVAFVDNVGVVIVAKLLEKIRVIKQIIRTI